MPHQYHQDDKKTYSKSKRYRGLTPLFNIKGKKMESFTNLFICHRNNRSSNNKHNMGIITNTKGR